MRTLLDMNKFVNRIYQQGDDLEEMGFIIANGKTSAFGEILHMSHKMMMKLDWSKEDAKLLKITNLMPKMISRCHN